MSEKSSNTENKENMSDLGFDLYPERRTGKVEPTWWEDFSKSPRTNIDKILCERNVQKAVAKSPLIKVLLGALKNAGCPVDLRRHIACEECDSKVQGGYDSEYNQIVVCKNVSKARDTPEVVLVHELIHMYDYCVNNVDFKNLEHLACTEIRAANLAHCSFLSSFLVGQSSFRDIKASHKDCVKLRAAYSLVSSRNVDLKSALNVVLKVFDRCYNDLEPIGRRTRRNSEEPYLAHEEAKCFGIL